MRSDPLDDIRWLVGDAGRAWLEKFADLAQPSPSATALLRRSLSNGQTRLLLEQVALRRRAKAKFSDAAAMFFTPRSLEQATDERTAAHKASRFDCSGPLADLCCGIGGDTRAMAGGWTLGVDRDRHVALLAAANSASAPIVVADATTIAIERVAAWHLDPDRRATGRRTTQALYFEPSIEAIDPMLERNPNAAIKLAPATILPESWSTAVCEWISLDGECKQLVAWFGSVAPPSAKCLATILRSKHDSPHTVSGDPHVAPPIAPRIGRYIFEPDAAVLAAKLTGALATRHALEAVSAGIAYLTGDAPCPSPALVAFRICEVMPFDLRRLKAWLREHRVGRLEVKKRGVDLDPEALRRQLRVPGDRALTLLAAPIAGRVTAILAERAD